MPERMRIGVISSPVITTPTNAERVPPGWSGSPEQMTAILADGLYDRGHEVTLFASGETVTRSNLVSIGAKSSYEDPEIGLGKHKQHEEALIAKAFATAFDGSFDILSSGFLFETAGLARILKKFNKTPTVSVLHSPLGRHPNLPLREIANDQSYVALSNKQRLGFEFINFVATIYHGIDNKKFAFNSQGGQEMVVVGRMHRDKGPHIAVEIAQKLGIKTKLVGSNWGTHNDGRDLYWEKVLDTVNPSVIELIGFAENTSSYYQHSKVLLNPIQYEEPFGLTVVESLSCGTPVVAFARGSMPELIEDGKTGFLVNPDDNDIRGNWAVKKTGTEGLVEAIQRIYGMSNADYINMRQLCRKRVETGFTIEKMIDRYEELFTKLVGVKNQ